MKKSDFQNIISDFFPAEDRRVQLDVVVQECNKKNMKMTRRTLQYFTTEGMISKPMRIGRSAYYDIGIYDEIAALFILKDILHISHQEIKDMLGGGATNVIQIVEKIHSALAKFFNWDEKEGKRALIFEAMNSKKAKQVIDKLVEEVSEGLELESIDINAPAKERKKIIIKRRK